MSSGGGDLARWVSGIGVPKLGRIASSRIYPGDRHVRRGQDEYTHALSQLLPQGIAWPRQLTSLANDPEGEGSSVVMKVVRGLAGVFGFCDGRAADLLERESDPRQAVELLPEWERAFGLPDPCYEGPSSISERQRHLVLRMTLLGGASKQFFIDVAAFLGYSISISEYRPFMVGLDRCGDNRAYDTETGTLGIWPCQIGLGTMRFAWTVHVHQVRLTWFRASKGQAGIDPHLRIALALDLECVLRRWRPAHTEVVFDYSGVNPPDPMAGVFPSAVDDAAPVNIVFPEITGDKDVGGTLTVSTGSWV